MMRSLCIDTSVLATMAVVDGENSAGWVTDPKPRHQAEGLPTLLSKCLAEAGLPARVPQAQIDRIAVGTGPGPFTALRAGIAFAAALGKGLGVPVFGVPSLAGLALQVISENLASGGPEAAVVLTDAKRKEVYAAGYALEDTHLEAFFSPIVGPIDDCLEASEIAWKESAGKQGQMPRVVFGGKWPTHLEPALADAGAAEVGLDPSYLAGVLDDMRARDSEADFDLVPLYLRRPDVHGGVA